MPRREVEAINIQLKMIDELIVAAYNPRRDLRPGDPEYEMLKKSILEFDYVEPIIWNQRTARVVGGHQRLKILKELGYTEVEVSVVDLPEDKEKALNLALNKISGEWDLPRLKDLLEELNTGDFDIEITGFDLVQIEDLMTQFSVPAEIIEDDFDVEAEVEKITDPITKPGDIWLLGRHRLMCGDSTDRETIVELMDGRVANMIFTDPPYNVDYGASKNPRHKIRSIENDNLGLEEWSIFCHKFYEVMREFVTGDIYMWGASGPDGMRMRLWLIDMGAHWSATIVWKKQQLVLSPAKYQRMYEPCFYGWFDKSSYTGDRKQVEVWEFDRPLNSKLHPTMKPIKLCAHGVENSSKPGDIVLDLFGGSGSTLMACEQVGRVCYVCELDPVYCEVIIKRWEEFTGQQAIKAEVK